jgi:hypothetical protein
LSLKADLFSGFRRVQKKIMDLRTGITGRQDEPLVIGKDKKFYRKQWFSAFQGSNVSRTMLKR